MIPHPPRAINELPGVPRHARRGASLGLVLQVEACLEAHRRAPSTRPRQANLTLGLRRTLDLIDRLSCSAAFCASSAASRPALAPYFTVAWSAGCTAGPWTRVSRQLHTRLRAAIPYRLPLIPLGLARPIINRTVAAT